MPKYEIIDREGEVLNVIKASADFMEQNYPPLPIIADNNEGPDEYWPQYREVVELSVVSVPIACTMAQARKALLSAGITAAMVETALEGNDMALIDWEYATTVRRDSALVQAVGSALGLPVDDLFQLAVTL